MTAKYKRFIVTLTFFLIIYPFISRASDQPQKELFFPVKLGSILDQALLVGSAIKPIVNPKSVSMQKLLDNNELYQEAQEAKALDLQAKYSIILEKAKESVTKRVRDYAKKNSILSIFEEVVFFKSLKLLPDFKDKTDEELRKLFDITDDILRAEREEKAKIKKKLFPRREFETTDPAANPFDDLK